jgi:LacI family transcriptional regulator
VAVTIHDVARHAGVSVATASRALSGSRRVSPDLAARVLGSARALGYRYNAVAGALRRRQTNTVGMVVPEISNPFFPAVVEAVERKLQESGRDLFLCDAQQDAATERRRVLALLGHQVDGLIITPVSATASRPSLTEIGPETPVVQVDRFVTDFAADWVGSDDEAGIAQIVRHVAALGARTCVFVSAEPNTSSAQQRLSSFTKAVLDCALAAYEPPLLGEFSIEWGRRAALALLALEQRPDAIVCGNDEIAMGVLRELRRHGIRVPDDVLVTGFDDIGFASLTDPPLTTVRQPREDIAAECVRLLDARIADPASPVRRVALATRLIIRESTGGRS